MDSFNIIGAQKEMPKLLVAAAMSSPLVQSKNRVPFLTKVDVNDRLWYFGSISRGHCDQMLNDFGDDGDFLIRDSETNVSLSISHSLKAFELDIKNSNTE
jgi:hypothetical protein